MKYTFEMESNEYWWGGTTIHNYCPITKKSSYSQDFRLVAKNQTMPMFLSNNGRVIWSDEPFAVNIENGIFTFEGENITLTKAGNTLKEAYIYAQKEHFPCDQKTLPDEFFKGAQFNSWIEFAYYSSQEKVLEYAHEIINHGFEPGIFIIDEGWHKHTSYGDWEFDFARFPEPKKMVEELHSLGFTVMLWVAPFVTSVGPMYFRSIHPLIGTDPESAKHLYKRTETGEVALIKWWDGVSAILDFTNPYDAEYLKNQLDRLMSEYGIDGFKFDGGSIENYSDYSVVNGKFDKKNTPEMCNIAWNEFGTRYKFHEYKDTYKGAGKNVIQRLHDRDHRWINNGIDDIIPCAITCGLIGHPFVCPDMVGGGEWLNRYTPDFKVDEELFVRMAQCSALFPMIQFSWAPWEALSEENMKLTRQAEKLHIRMSDTIISLVREAEKTGEPIIRCLEYNYPHCNYESINDEFMLGEDILVCPVVTQNTSSRNVVFPEGKWVDEKGTIYEGNQTKELSAPLDTLLWFTRLKQE